MAVIVCASTQGRASPPSASPLSEVGNAALKSLQGFAMDRWSVDGGGGASAAGSFALTGAAGQPDSAVSSSCGTVLAGGLWSGPVDLHAVFCDGFESGSATAWSAVVGAGN
jgi:hypothetical protein